MPGACHDYMGKALNCCCCPSFALHIRYIDSCLSVCVWAKQIHVMYSTLPNWELAMFDMLGVAISSNLSAALYCPMKISISSDKSDDVQ